MRREGIDDRESDYRIRYAVDRHLCLMVYRRGGQPMTLPPENGNHAPCEETPVTAIELFDSNGKSSGIWYCSECRTVYKDMHFAQQCHGVTHCETCGVSLVKRAPYYKKQCEECDRKDWRARQVKEEFERYTKAVKIAATEYTGPQVFFNDQYYPTVEEAIDECDEPPEYVWAAKNVGLRKATINDLIERILEEAWEDAEPDDLNGLNELQIAVDAFNAANSEICVYMADYNEAIVLDDSILEEWGRDQGRLAACHRRKIL